MTDRACLQCENLSRSGGEQGGEEGLLSSILTKAHSFVETVTQSVEAVENTTGAHLKYPVLEEDV